MKKQDCYTLFDISTWAKDDDVSLPTVQRGFVWKPSQIENLWDSLLRGYPVGAFVLSLKPEPQAKTHVKLPKAASFELLDGQQRATAICLGFGSHTFRQSEKRFKIFIDLEPPSIEDTRKYLFRVITSSHPWGYQRKDNSKTLDSGSIKNAMKLYGIDDHLGKHLDNFFPYDAVFPVPFDYFLRAAVNDSDSGREVVNAIYSWEHWKTITGEKAKATLPRTALFCDSAEKVEARIVELLGVIKKMLEEVKVPALYLDYSHIVPNQRLIPEPRLMNDAQVNGKLDSAEEPDEVENLFIRLNSGGTPLRGEELNYSILKARIDKKLQNAIEVSCEGLLVPARFITIAYRLYQHQRKVEFRDAISMKIKPKQFQKTMADNADDFKTYLEKLLTLKEFDNRTLLEQVKYVLAYDKENNNRGFPYLIYSRVAAEAPEVMFLLLYRLIIKKDLLDPRENHKVHQRMLGMISLFLWLGKGENQRDHSRLLSDIWPSVKTLEGPLFWSSSTIQRARLNDALLPFPPEAELDLPVDPPRANVDVLSKTGSNEGFFRRMFFNRDLVLYAQRHSLSLWFENQHYDLDDTNVPFDWDHISPNKFCHNKRRIPKALKMIYNSNGNFRAWPYSLNRFDQDDVPARKLNPLSCENLPENQTEEKTDKRIKQLLQHFNSRYNMELKRNLSSEKKLKATLLNWSFCTPDWSRCADSDMKKEWKTVYQLIIGRNISICKEWYENLAINSLIPASPDVDFGKLVSKKWIRNPKELKELFGAEYDSGDTYWLNKIDTSQDPPVHLFIGYENGEELRKNGIEFGIIVDDVNRIVDKRLLVSNDAFKYNDRWILSEFTLISNDYDSYVDLLASMRKWLEEFPNERIPALSAVFAESFSPKMKKALRANTKVRGLRDARCQ